MSLYSNAKRDDRVREYLTAVRIVTQGNLDNPERLLNKMQIQSFNAISAEDCIKFNPGAFMVLDFGKELHGGIRIVTGLKHGTIRLRFGESVSEVMANPNQDHSIHDETLKLPFMGALEYGSTGFRFVRIDALDETTDLLGVTAVALYRDLKRVGSFKCNDERINQVWETGLYTVQMCMQDYIYDGIKRDRLVWLGDLNPELRIVLSVFDDCSILKDSMDFLKARTPLPKYMNSMLSYSCWWIINQYEYYLHKGEMDYLKAQSDYLKALTRQFIAMIRPDGTIDTDGAPIFLDWPSSVDKVAQAAGGQGLFYWMFNDAAKLLFILGENALASEAANAATTVKKLQPDCRGVKPVAAIQTVSGLCDRSDVLLADHLKGVSTFYGYYMLLGQPVPDALELIRKYWGAMLDFGATTFWEDFDLEWTKNASPIDQLPQPGKADIHADFGNFCYQGLRHSLCHGWAGGPTAFLMEKVLGIRVTAPGSRTISLKPELGGLEYAQGTFPTPYGPLHVNVSKNKVDYEVPKEITIIQ